jgi:hypothetical protein
MKGDTLFIILFFTLIHFLLFSYVSKAQTAESASYLLCSIISTGGTNLTGTEYEMYTVVGQTITGNATGSVYTTQLGWFEECFFLEAIFIGPVDEEGNLLQFSGTLDYLNVFWNAYYSGGTERDIGVSCYLDCNPEIQDCSSANNCTYIGPVGKRSCTIVNPLYNFGGSNTVFCKIYDPLAPDTTFGYTNRSFSSIDFDVFTPSDLRAIVGEEIDLRVIVKNFGLLVDSYVVNVTSPSPLISIHPSTAVTTIGPLTGDYMLVSESGYTLAKLIPLSSIGTATLRIAVNSTTVPFIGIERWLTIKSGTASLSEFDVFGVVQIIILATLVLVFIQKKVL